MTASELDFRSMFIQRWGSRREASAGFVCFDGALRNSF